MSDIQTYSVKNVVNGGGIQTQQLISVQNGGIVSVTDSKTESAEFAYAVPGFIDMHLHGGNGADVMDASDEALSTIAEFHLSSGTTTVLCSTLTAPLDDIEKALLCGRKYMPANRKRAADGQEAAIAGFHIEGPWLSKMNLGAQNPEYIHPPGEKARALVGKYSDIIRMVTFSYHTPEAKEFLPFLRTRNIIAACGHDESIDYEMLEGYRNGISQITHIYCNTAGFRRTPELKTLGTIETALMTPGVAVECIADGNHIPETFWKFIRHNKQPGDIICVSDSIRYTGMPEDPNVEYKLGELDIILEEGAAWLADHSCFAGSISTLHSQFKRLVLKWDVPINEAVQVTSVNQAERLGLGNRLAKIAPGYTADMLLLDENLNIVKIIKNGIEKS